MSTEATRQRDRRAAAFEAFLELVTEYGTATITCDMESYGREPGDIVTVMVAAPMDGHYTSHEIEFTAEDIKNFAALIGPLYESDAMAMTRNHP